ncbi:MAG: DUF4382 domain-containing protein [Sulfurovum sp.]|nr:DUF4382 domain-containing protein [Sulfurovum sp.]
MKHTKTLLSGLFALLMIPFLIACGGSSTDTQVGVGTVAFNLTDAPGDYAAVYVTVKEVRVHMSENEAEDDNESSSVAEDQNETEDEAGWKIVAEPNKTYNLLELQDGVKAFLGEENLTAGHYTQVRLILADQADESNNTLDQGHEYPNYVLLEGDTPDAVDTDPTQYELVVPSAYQSGIKLIKGFDVIADTKTELTIDFDAAKSVFENQGAYKMKPTIKIIQE